MDDKYGHYHIKPSESFWQSVRQVLILYRYQVILIVVVPAVILGALNTWWLWDVLTHKAALILGVCAFMVALGIGGIGALYMDYRESVKREEDDKLTWWTEERG